MALSICNRFFKRESPARGPCIAGKHIAWSQIEVLRIEIACCVVFVFSNYSTSFSNDDFSSFTNSTKEARLLRNVKDPALHESILLGRKSNNLVSS